MNLLEIDKPKVKKTVVVYSGRFQPFHKGHYASYAKLVAKFGEDNVYIGTSNDQSGPKSPFSFKEKKEIATKMFGISSNKFVQIRNPYQPLEILKKFDGKTTQYIAAVGEKDATRLQGKYFKPYKNKAGYGYDEIGYVYAVPAEQNPISGTDVRNWLGVTDKEKAKKGFLKAYPKFDKEIFKMITDKLNENFIKGYPSEEDVKKIHARNVKFRKKATTNEIEKIIKDIESDVNVFIENYFEEKLSETKQQSIEHFIEFATKRLKLKENPKINLVGSREFAEVKRSLGGFNAETKEIYVSTEGRLTADILRTIAHEMVHRKQDELGFIKNEFKDGTDGSPIENQANAIAGILMREYGRINKQIYNEYIALDIDKGDTILMGKFKNKKVKVKDIGEDPHGMPTINGKQATTFRKFKNESLLTEGGAYGHMSHPFDDMDLTFGDLKNIITGALNGDLGVVREKTDGQALAVSWKNGRLIAARNKGHLANAGANAMGIEDVASKFGGRGGLTDAYNFAMKDLSAAISSLSEAQRKKIFNDGKCFMNLEVIWPKSVNVIPYGQALLIFHNTTCYDEKGSAIGADQGASSTLAGMIKQVNADVQSKYTIQGPPITEIPKNEDLSSKQSKYLSKLKKLQFEYNLNDGDTVAMYHQSWWDNFVDKKAPIKVDKLTKEALVRRWAFGDKNFRLNTISNPKLKEWAIDNDKVNVAKQQKDNIKPFEDIFLGVGADVLDFVGSVLTVHPEKAIRAIKSKLKSVASDVRSGGDKSKIQKLKQELKRLNNLGGIERIVANEGLVFFYNGKTYKLTGTFAPLNQILGLFY